MDRTGSGSCSIEGLVLTMLILCVLLPESLLVGEMDHREIGCEEGSWIELAQDRVQ